MKKQILLYIGVLGLLFLVGCAGSNVDQDTLLIDKAGSITQILVDDFNKDYYSEAEFQTMVETELQTYNANLAVDRIRLEELELDESGKMLVKIAYDGSSYYAEYNQEIFFAGTVAEAMESGYDLSGECMSTDGALTDITMIEDYENKHVVVLEEAIQVSVPGKILGVSRSGEVAITESKLATVGKEGEIAFIIYN